MQRGFDYATEPVRDILFIDVKSFYGAKRS